MGLDIFLIEPIENNETSELNWLEFEGEKKISKYFKNFIVSRNENDENLGIYYKDISYQRKGVKREFYENYKPDDFIVLEEEVLELKKYILEEYLEDFDQKFLQKFKEKKNLVWISY